MNPYIEDFRYDLRCVVYAPVGEMIGWLPDPKSIVVGFTADSDPSLIVEVYKNSPAATLLRQPCELAVEVWNQAANKWVEPINGRFLALNWSEDTNDPLGVLKFTCPGILYLLDKIKVRKGKADDKLVNRAKEVEDWYTATKREYESALTTYKNAWEPVRKRFKMTGGFYAENFFPKSTAKTKIPSRSVLMHMATGVMYHYWSNTGKWHRFTGTGENGKILSDNQPKIGEAAQKMTGWRRNLAHVTAIHNRAQYASRNATRNKQRPLLNSEPTALLARHWKEAQDLGGGRLKGVNRTWAWGKDSKGVRWPERRDHEAKIGESLKSLVDNMVEAGEISWQTRGREFDIMPQGAFEVWHGDKFSLRLGRDIIEAPDKGSRAEFASSFIVSGDEDYVNAFSVAEPGPWGAWEESFSITGVKTHAQAVKETNGYRPTRIKAVKVESTRELLIRTGSPRPMIDYLPGHSLLVEGPEGLERRSIVQVTLTRDERGDVGGNIVLGDRFMNRALNWSKSLSKVANGQDTIMGNSTMGQQVNVTRSVVMGPGAVAADTVVRVAPNGTPTAGVRLTWSGLLNTGLAEGVAGVDSSEDELDPE